MNEHLYQYFFVADTARRKVFTLTVILLFGAGVVCDRILGLSPESAAHVAIAVGALAVSASALRYRPVASNVKSRRKERKVRVPERGLDKRRGFALAQTVHMGIQLSRLAWAVAAILVFVCVAFVPYSRVEASILEGRLKQTANGEVTLDNLRKAASVASAAREARLTADPKVVAQIGRKFLDASKANPNLTVDAVTAVTALINFNSFLDVRETEQRNALAYANLPLCGEPEHMIAEVPVRNGEFGEPEDLRYTYPSGYSDCTLILDGKPLRNSVVFFAQVRYTGGPLSLDNVKFEQCRFSFSDHPSASDVALASALLRSRVVTLHLD